MAVVPADRLVKLPPGVDPKVGAAAMLPPREITISQWADENRVLTGGAAAERGLQFVKGSDFVLEGGESDLRIAYSGVTPAQIEEGVQRLAEAYQEVTASTRVGAA